MYDLQVIAIVFSALFVIAAMFSAVVLAIGPTPGGTIIGWVTILLAVIAVSLWAILFKYD